MLPSFSCFHFLVLRESFPRALLLWLELRRLPPIMGFVGLRGPGLVTLLLLRVLR